MSLIERQSRQDGDTALLERPNLSRTAWPPRVSPQLATLVDHPPTGQEWLHEIKFDGYRLLAFIKSGRTTLFTRNANDWTHRFKAVAAALSQLKLDFAVIDGEVVILDSQGRSDFQALQAMLKGETRPTPIFFAFDLLFLNGQDLRDQPLSARKALLERLLKRLPPDGLIRYSQHVTGDGEHVLARACRMGLEGILSKRIDSPYRGRRDLSWLKSKCGQRQEFVVIGWSDPRKSRKHFGSLLLGYHDERNRLVYAGRVGTGFDEQLLSDVAKKLEPISIKHPPTDLPPPRRELRSAHWVKPVLVAEVRFTGWTRDGVLRHPAFIALRSDKPAAAVKRESAIDVEQLPMATTRKTPPGGSRSEIQIAGVRVTHPDKVLYPERKITKEDVATWYAAAQKWMLPHVIDRPLALVRCPEGRAAKCFFQRNWSSTMPPAIDKVDVSADGKSEQHVCIHDFPGLVSLVQMGILEIHTWNCTQEDIEHCDQLVFDLDPGPGVTWKQVMEGARKVRKALADLKLPSFLKTSGGKGLHLTVPLVANVAWEPAKAFAQSIVQALSQSSPLFIDNMRKDLRQGKIYIDYLRNGRGATAVAPYSTRARDGAPVSMPISWEELGKLKSADQFTVDKAAGYLKKRKQDPWRDFDKSRVDLRKLVKA